MSELVVVLNVQQPRCDGIYLPGAVMCEGSTRRLCGQDGEWETTENHPECMGPGTPTPITCDGHPVGTILCEETTRKVCGSLGEWLITPNSPYCGYVEPPTPEPPTPEPPTPEPPTPEPPTPEPPTPEPPTPEPPISEPPTTGWSSGLSLDDPKIKIGIGALVAIAAAKLLTGGRKK